MKIEAGRILFLNKEKNDQLLSVLAKEYKGKFYKKLKNSYGWSFPIQYENQIRSALKNSEYCVADSPHSESTTTNEVQNEYSETLSHPQEIQTDPTISSDDLKESDNSQDTKITITKRDIATQTGEILYKYDLPDFIIHQFNDYKHLKT